MMRLILTTAITLLFAIFLVINYCSLIANGYERLINLASVFVSALAFMWLIFGYQQQAEELKLQRIELRNQVENTKKLAEQTELQAKANLEFIDIEKRRIKDEYLHSIRPMLIFSNTGTNESGENIWFVKNVGNSSAMNVTISGSAKLGEWDENHTVLFPALNLNDVIKLTWITRPGALLAIYADIDENHFTTLCSNNKNTISKENRYPELVAKKAHWTIKT